MDAATAVLQALTTSEHAGLVMDFDGVLSQITDDPGASELLPGTEEILAGLAGKLPVVALLSGRPVAFLAERAGTPGVELYGSYGLEHLTDHRIEVVPEARQWMTAVEEATQVLHQQLDGVEGIHVEDKSLAVAVHWRRAPDQAGALKLITPLIREVLDTYGLRHEPGKFVEELRMPLEQDKGTALRRIISAENLRTVAYAGDDLGDLPAFEAATAAGGYTLVIDGPDMAPEVGRIAGAHFSSPQDFQSWLRHLDDALR
ncbi:trehalose-phosphatase [Arthrobacter sp. NPDC092385]|uniref:trehalose-phosphatase n=1 Tax=Arthrobacter sp. NPDC092385 TaxID=3363943 RepID=UPI003829EF68